MSLPRFLYPVAAFVAAALLAGAALAASPALPSLNASIDGGHLTSQRVITLAGNLTCTERAHFHLNAWIEQADRGTLGKGSIPAKLGPKPSKVAVSRARALTLCTGAAQPWSLPVLAVGAHPAGFATGTANACVIAYAGKSHLYTLFQNCTAITIG
jgi:hypothetical protein